jgi:hypothetical protein
MTNGPGRLPDAALDALEIALAPVDGWIAGWPARDAADELPIHAVVVPADQATPGVCAAWGRAALDALDEHAPGPVSLAMATGLPADAVEAAWPALRRRLQQRPVQDLRIDLAPGARPAVGARDAEDVDDANVERAVGTLLHALADDGGPTRCGIRHGGVGADVRRRTVRGLDRVVGLLADAGGPPDGFRLTLPGIVHVDQVAAYSALLRVLEVAHDLPEDRLVFELQVDAPEAVLAADGTVPLRAMIDAAGRRCVGIQLDPVGFGAAVGIAPSDRAMDGTADTVPSARATDGMAHAVPAAPAGDPVRTAEAIVRLAAASARIAVVGGAGAAHVGAGGAVPVDAGAAPTVDDRAVVHALWRAHVDHVARERAGGVLQGWDVHPLQLVTRHLVALAGRRPGDA